MWNLIRKVFSSSFQFLCDLFQTYPCDDIKFDEKELGKYLTSKFKGTEYQIKF